MHHFLSVKKPDQVDRVLVWAADAANAVTAIYRMFLELVLEEFDRIEAAAAASFVSRMNLLLLFLLCIRWLEGTGHQQTLFQSPQLVKQDRVGQEQTGQQNQDEFDQDVVEAGGQVASLAAAADRGRNAARLAPSRHPASSAGGQTATTNEASITLQAFTV